MLAMNADPQKGPGSAAASASAAAPPWAPFRHVAFTVIWTATIVSNIGTWMYNAASSWLMTSLDADPLVVSMVQVAASLPMFLFAIPAGALADIIDKRRFLLFAESATTLLCAIVAALVWRGTLTPVTLLAFTFLLGAASALTAPCWQSVVPELVPRQDLPPAVAANSVGINISRAVGPALGGVVTAVVGIAAPFWINAASNLAIVAALLWWRSPRPPASRLPAERLMSAMSVGIRHARYNRQLRATLLRGTGFFLFASAYWALLPLVARGQIAGGPELYGLLLGTIGAGALLGAFALPSLKASLGTDRLVAAATLGTAAALVLFGLARETAVALAAGAIAGFSWIAALASFNVSAQLSLPDWVRGRGLAIFVTVLFGAMTLGSVIWGQLAAMIGLPGAHFVAALGALLAVPLTWRWKLQTGVGADLTPSMHWPTPVLSGELEHDRGPVMVTVEYRISPENREPFLAATEKLGHGRRRDGAYAWGIFEDAAEEGRYLETFLVESWLEHLRQHQRVTNADRIAQDAIRRFHIDGEPKVTHFISADPRR
jgi:predicted MFS family arabinose efflux permease